MFCSKTIWRKSIAVAVVPAPSATYKILEHILLYELNYLSFLEAFGKLFLLKKNDIILRIWSTMTVRLIKTGTFVTYGTALF